MAAAMNGASQTLDEGKRHFARRQGKEGSERMGFMMLLC